MILAWTLFAAALCYFTYCVIPTCYYKWFKRPALSNEGKNILLTFDDGPNPKYTEQLLSLLAKHCIHATFFVLAEKVNQNRQVVHRMIDEGHEVSLHALEHKSSWLKGPVYMKRDFNKSMEILSSCGKLPRYYRPPWGDFNLATLFLAKKYGLRILLWNVMAEDWEKSSTPMRVYRRLRLRTRNGSVICLHDCGVGSKGFPGAPEIMIEALSEYIPFMINKGYRFVLPKEVGL